MRRWWQTREPLLGRKARRIRKLEAELRDALDNLVVVKVRMAGLGHGIVVHKDTWYRISFQFKVSEDRTYADVSDLLVAEETEPDRARWSGEAVT